MDAYNRQLHQSEQDKLKALQKGKSAEEQYRLAAAECALVHCADGHEARGNSGPYMPDTPVIQGFTSPGTRESMVLDQRQTDKILGGQSSTALGGWSNSDNVLNQNYARDNLAITPGFKFDVGHIVGVETTAPVPTNRGLVGPQLGANGGGNQTEYLIPQ